jgi:hypothetical protein
MVQNAPARIETNINVGKKMQQSSSAGDVASSTRDPPSGETESIAVDVEPPAPLLSAETEFSQSVEAAVEVETESETVLAVDVDPIAARETAAVVSIEGEQSASCSESSTESYSSCSDSSESDSEREATAIDLTSPAKADRSRLWSDSTPDPSEAPIQPDWAKQSDPDESAVGRDGDAAVELTSSPPADK